MDHHASIHAPASRPTRRPAGRAAASLAAIASAAVLAFGAAPTAGFESAPPATTANTATVASPSTALAEAALKVLPGIIDETPVERSGVFRPAAPSFGLRLPAGEDRDAGTAGTWLVGAEPAPKRVVVLVHGLDDPGWVFKDILKPLRDAGFEPVELIYPNDGPIGEATDRFAVALESLRDLGVEHVDVVAHSMGGLVTRDVLTRAEYYDGDARGGDRYPAIQRFVMCGTPNLGSRAAHIRWLAEAREHLTRSLSGRGHLFGGLRDGRGEAGDDLLPESPFLADLNARAFPQHVAITCVVAHATPVGPNGAGRAAGGIRRRLGGVGGPKWWRRFVGGIGEVLAGSIDGSVQSIGDGVVTLASARMPGATDIVTVKGNHASMLAKLLPVGRKLPPAIPIVLDRLAEAAAAGEASRRIDAADGEAAPVRLSDVPD